RDGAELAQGRPGQRGDRVERGIADQLEPDLVAQLRLDRRLQPARGERGGDSLAALADRAIGLADGEPGALGVLDDAGLDDLGGAVDDAADVVLGADRAGDLPA